MKQLNMTKVLGVFLITAMFFAALPYQSAFAESAGVLPALTAGADRLVAVQNDDGGWDWKVADDGNPASISPLNTIAPTAKGLAMAYLQTNDPDHLTALQKTGDLLLTKTTFATSDGYLADQLDKIFGVTTYSAYVKANFFDKLALGTYDRNGILYNTESYVNLIRTSRSGQSANLAAWDLGIGLVSATLCGVNGAELDYWINGVKAEIDELDPYYDADGPEGPEAPVSAYYLPDGIAGALYGLAFVGEDFDPTTGYYASASNLTELFSGLIALQNGSGGFVWHPDFLLENDQNENTQATAYAILAMD